MNAIFSTVMRPGARWMRRMRVPLKLSLMGTVLLVPLVLLVIHGSQTANQAIALTRSEQAGAEAVGLLTEVVTEVQTHRGLTSRVLAGDETAQAPLRQTRERLKAALAKADQGFSHGTVADNALSDEWKAAREAAQALAAGRHAERRDQAFAQHSTEVARLQQLVLRVGEVSGLLLDPDADTFFLMDLVVQRLGPWTEALALARGQGAGLLSRGDASALERASVLGRADSLGTQLTELQFRIEALQRAGVAAPAEWPTAMAATQDFSALLREAFGGDALQTAPGAYFDRGSAAIRQVLALHHRLLQELSLRLAQREQRAVQELWLQLGASAAGLLLMLYLAAAFYISFLGALRTLHKGVLATAQGDLAHKTQVHGKDELADIGSVVEGMSQRLSAMVAEIRSSAVRVGLSGQQVAISGEALAQRTHSQAVSLRQTTGTVAQLSEAVASNANAAKELDELTIRLRAQAEAGGAAMRETIGSMAALEGSSKRVGEIISVIDGIAFQTNILALNAAVEAARAGDAGRGFAVVAAEVRQLALRSSTASAEIKQLIGQSTQQVGDSVGRIQQVGVTLDGVVAGVRDVSDRLRGIAMASAQQSSGLEEVSQSVGNLDELTKQNAQMVSESSASADDLVTRAAALSEAVGAIRLRQGSADEAQTLVQRALDQIEIQGYDSAAAHFRQPNSGYVDRDLYVFTIDRQGTYRLHSAKPANEGKRVHDVPGIDGDRFVREAWAATQGNHWVEYDILNAESGQVQPKASYVVALNDKLLIGCGIYRQSTTGAPPALALTR